MPEIFSVTPGRGRAGEKNVLVSGAGFAPATPFGNNVDFDGNFAFPNTQDETDIDVDAPGCFGGFGLCVTDQWVTLIVQRGDTFEFDVVLWWVKADLTDLKTDSGLTEKIPGPTEDLDDPTNECLTATTWNRLATFAEFLIQEVLTAKGSVLSRDSSGPAELLVGGDGEEIQRVAPTGADPTGLRWIKPLRFWTLRWGKLIAANNSNNGAMRANGTADDQTTSTKAGTHGMPRPGELRRLVVNVESASGGDTLDRVQLVVNLGLLHDSGTGLAISADGAYTADIDTWHNARDVEVRVFKTGAAGTMQLNATLQLVEELRPGLNTEDTISDALAVTDAITAEIVLGREASDAVASSDFIAVETDGLRELTDALSLVDTLAADAIYDRVLDELPIDVADAIHVELL